MVKNLLDSDGSDREDVEVQTEVNTDFKVNKDFARRFTYNKEREELRRLEDKFGPDPTKRKRPDDRNNISAGTDGDTSDSEEEDDAGDLATEALDSEIQATLDAIKSRDPRVYNKEVTFYTETGEEDVTGADYGTEVKREKPMFLRDYHREKLLNGLDDDSKEDSETLLTYHQEQDALKRSIVGEINAAAVADSSDSVSSDVAHENERDDDDFLVAKPQRQKRHVEGPKVDVEQADKDPGAFLSNFMAARAWIPTERSQFQPFESDDEEEDRKADEFEEAYNLRFEDPEKANEKLVSHARDTAAKYSVRREDANPRKKKREAERKEKDTAEREKAQERARLRKLKIKEAEEKLRKIKKAAGAGIDRGLPQDEWISFLDDDWDDARWEEEMRKRFDDTYYTHADVGSGEDDETHTRKRKRPKKPKWNDDIDISDLVPDHGENTQDFRVSNKSQEIPVNGSTKASSQRPETKKDRKISREEKKMEAQREKIALERLVDQHLDFDSTVARSQERSGGFRYRESSPVSFGLSARDILMAEDSQLNQFAGLKKLAPFRDPTKKRKDQKHLGKKARLRQWRKDTFSDENGQSIPDITSIPKSKREASGKAEAEDVEPDIRAGPAKKKRRRSKKNQGNQDLAVEETAANGE